MPVRATPPLLEVHVAVYFGVDSGLPLACTVVNFEKLTRSLRDATLATTGLLISAGAPTVIAGDAVDAEPVPTPFVAFTVHVYRQTPSVAVPEFNVH